MWVYDFEVFKRDWMVAIKHLVTNQTFEFVNDQPGLMQFYKDHETDLHIGFNNKKYDDYIYKGILLGENPKVINDILIEENNILKVWRMFDINKYNLNSLDISQDAMFASLKELEGWFGLDIMESSVPFNIDRALTQDEIDDVMHYCRHDVHATHHIAHELSGNIETKMRLVSEFGLTKGDLKKTNAQLTATILGAHDIKDFGDEFTPYEPIAPLQINDREILEFYTKPEGGKVNYDIKLVKEIAGVEHTLAYGGLHGARPQYEYEGEMWMLDGKSYYPSMMLEFGFMSRGIPKRNLPRFKEIYDTRFDMQRRGIKGDEHYKLVLNTKYGCLKNKYNPLFDPKMANNVTVTGQLLLIDLIEKIEPYITLVQSNTDGILIIPHNKEKIMEAVREWEARTNLPMEVEKFKAIYQKDVNNYIMVAEDDYLILKGGFVNQSKFGNARTMRVTNRILHDCVVNYFVNKVTPEETIRQSNDLMDYQIITKTGNTFDRTIWKYAGMDIPAQKVNRVYATRDKTAGKLFKIKTDDQMTESYHAIASLPDHCKLDNENEFNITQLDKDWYVEEAWERIRKYRGLRKGQ